VRYSAALFDGPGLPLRLAEFALPPVGPGELLVRITACTICGSDLHTLAGRRPAPVPSILGHEALGLDVSTGQRVTWSIMASCGHCPFCLRGLPQNCEALFKYGHAKHETRPSGGLSEYIILRLGTTVLPVPDSLPDAVACPLNCATATIAACLRPAGNLAAADVLIQGAGLLGLTAAALAAAAGAAQIHAVHPDSSSLPPVDFALELSGHSAALPPLRIGGLYVLAGAVFSTPPLPLDPETLVRRLLRIQGVHDYTPADLATALEFLLQHHHRHPFAELVPQSFPLSQINEALAYQTLHRPARVLIRP